MCLLSCLFRAALWSPAGKGITPWRSFMFGWISQYNVEEVVQNDLLVKKVTISGLETHIPPSNGAVVLIQIELNVRICAF